MRTPFVCGMAAVLVLAVGSTVAVGATLTFTDELDVAGGGSGRTILNTTDPNFDGIDDTFDGIVTYTFTTTFDALQGGGAADTFGGFQLYNGGVENLGVSDQWQSPNWSYYRAAGAAGGIGNLDNGSGTLAIAVGDPQTFNVAITFVAGANDTAVITWNGNANTLPAGNYSFDNVHVRAGNDATQADFTNMSMTIVPEPCTLALASLGLTALVRRRRK